MAKSSSGTSGGRSRQAGKRRKAKPPAASVLRQLSADQLWCHFSNGGGEWLLLRLASPLRTPSDQSPLPDTQCQLLGAGEFSVSIAFAPNKANR